MFVCSASPETSWQVCADGTNIHCRVRFYNFCFLFEHLSITKANTLAFPLCIWKPPASNLRLSGNPTLRCEGDIKLDLKEKGTKVCGYALNSFDSRHGPEADSCDFDNEISESMKGRQFLD
jgi:hypothetical protein